MEPLGSPLDAFNTLSPHFPHFMDPVTPLLHTLVTEETTGSPGRRNGEAQRLQKGLKKCLKIVENTVWYRYTQKSLNNIKNKKVTNLSLLRSLQREHDFHDINFCHDGKENYKNNNNTEHCVFD